MALFPVSPINGQQTTVNNITYTYDSTQTAWVGTSTSSNNNVIYSVANGITAAGTVQANAQGITKDINIVNTVVAGSGVSLPTAVAGYRITIVNTSANTLNVYPLGNGIINTQTANTAFSHPAGARLDFICTATATAPGGQWYTLNTTYA